MLGAVGVPCSAVLASEAATKAVLAAMFAQFPVVAVGTHTLPERKVLPKREVLPEIVVLPNKEVLPESEALPNKEVLPEREALPEIEVLPESDAFANCPITNAVLAAQLELSLQAIVGTQTLHVYE